MHNQIPSEINYSLGNPAKIYFLHLKL